MWLVDRSDLVSMKKMELLRFVVLALSALSAVGADAFDFEAEQRKAAVDDALIPHLNAGDFTNHSLVARGNWFLFFGSRNCPHCLHLTPKWRQLYQEKQELLLTRNLRMAKVECMDNIDFCNNQIKPKFTRFPTLRFFVDGHMTAEFEGRDASVIPDVEAFLMKHFETLPLPLRNPPLHQNP
ncbi:hypothetical protein BC830DRAFT_310289 [Chytriomyces sp. MP71]|nr:hypothetical protein BC830DRAFT_310289 [Chytriomyces sp. MP71]